MNDYVIAWSKSSLKDKEMKEKNINHHVFTILNNMTTVVDMIPVVYTNEGGKME